VQFSTKAAQPAAVRSGCIVLGVFAGRELSAAARSVDRASQGYLSRILKHGDLEGRLGSTLLLHGVPGTAAERVLLVGLGKASEFGPK